MPWKKRFLDNGVEGLQKHSRKSHSNYKKVTEEVVCEMFRTKNISMIWGPGKIHQVYSRYHPGKPRNTSWPVCRS